MKKIYYVPGLISALVIPLLFWHYGNQKMNEPKIVVMDFGIPPKLKKGSDPAMLLEPLRTWDFKQIPVSPGEGKKNSGYYVSEIKKLQKRNKKHTAIAFILDSINTYGDFASLINDMAIAKHENYALDIEKTGNFLVPVIYKNTSEGEKESESLLYNDTIITWEKGTPSISNRFNEFISNVTKKGNYILFSFLLFLNISMLSIKERFLLRQK